MASIADVFFSAYLEDKGLQADAMKAGDTAGQTLGQRMSGGIGTAMRAGLGVVGAAAGIATKGLLELENVTADFRAETGATAEEAEKAGKAINEMAGRNLQPMAEIGDALAKVHTDLGQTGEAAEETAEDFLHFARVTGQDAASEVAAFDDILDAWGLTAEDSQEIMDKLIVSHQEYGGSITENEAALAAMAPALKALNADVDDGIGLLNLFAASGLDASAAQAALKKAVAGLEPGQGLDDLIAQISSIEDPTLRAQEAMEIFGARGGTGLANALQPGIDSLDDFQIATEDATGATEEAQQALDGTFSNRVKLAIKGVTSQIIEFGSSFGPAVTGLASLASLGGALGFGKIGGKLAGGIIAGLATAKVAMLGFFQDISLGRSTGLAGAVNRAGASLGRLFGIAFSAVGKLASLIGASLLALPGAEAIKNAAVAAGARVGTTMGISSGSAYGAAFLAALIPGLAVIGVEINRVIEGVNRTADEVTHDVEEMQRDFGDFKIGPINVTELLTFGEEVDDTAAAAGQALDQTAADFAAFPERVGDAFAAGAPAVEAGAEAGILEPVDAALVEMIASAAQGGIDAVQALSTGIRAGWDDAQGAWESLKTAMEHPISRMKRIAKLEGRLSSKTLADALKSNDPLVREAAEDLVATTEAELAKLYGIGRDKGDRGGEGFADGLFRTRGEAKDAAQAVARAAAGVLEGLNLRDEGADAGGEFASGLRSTIRQVAAVAAALAAVVAQYLEFGSPTELGPFSKKGGPAGWARIGADDWVGGWDVDPTAALARLAASARNALAAPLAGAMLPIGASVAATGVAGGDIGGLTVNGGIHLHGIGSDVSPQRARDFGQQVLDEVAGGFRRQAARLPTGTRA